MLSACSKDSVRFRRSCGGPLLFTCMINQRLRQVFGCPSEPLFIMIKRLSLAFFSSNLVFFIEMGRRKGCVAIGTPSSQSASYIAFLSWWDRHFGAIVRSYLETNRREKGTFGKFNRVRTLYTLDPSKFHINPIKPPNSSN